MWRPLWVKHGKTLPEHNDTVLHPPTDVSTQPSSCHRRSRRRRGTHAAIGCSRSLHPRVRGRAARWSCDPYRAPPQRGALGPWPGPTRALACARGAGMTSAGPAPAPTSPASRPAFRAGHPFPFPLGACGPLHWMAGPKPGHDAEVDAEAARKGTRGWVPGLRCRTAGAASARDDVCGARGADRTTTSWPAFRAGHPFPFPLGACGPLHWMAGPKPGHDAEVDAEAARKRTRGWVPCLRCRAGGAAAAG
jgi:hypothetical protein